MRGKGTKTLQELKLLVEGKKGSNGRALCCWCQQEIPKGRRSWCSKKCVEEYRAGHDWRYMTKLIRIRDKGLCQKCGIDVIALRKALREMTDEFGIQAARQYAATMGIPASRVGKRLFDIDHIIPCALEGTDELTNLRLLCISCHRAATTALQRRLAERRRETDDLRA